MGAIKQLDNNRHRKKYKNKEIEDINKYFNEIFAEEDGGYVRLFNKNGAIGLNLTMSSLLDLENLKKALNYVGKEDCMYSLNLFKQYDKSNKNNIQALRICAVDIDFKKTKYKDLPKENIIKLLELDYFNSIIPIPTIIEYGNQIRLLYILSETVGATKRSKMLMDRIQQVFAENLREFGAEKQTLTSYARVPHSINTKTGDIINIIKYEDYRYTLDELKNDWLEDLPQWYKPYLERRKNKLKRNRSKKVIKKVRVNRLFNTYTLNLARIEDLERIQEFYNFNLDNDKEYLCFLYRNHCLLSGMTNKEAEEKTKKYYLNFKSANEHKWRKIESQTRNVERHTYFIPNHRILTHLGITPEEEIELELQVTITKEEKRRRDFSKRKESRRNQNGLTNREQQKLDLINKIKELKSKGMKQKEVSEKLEKGISTIKRYWNI